MLASVLKALDRPDETRGNIVDVAVPEASSVRLGVTGSLITSAQGTL